MINTIKHYKKTIAGMSSAILAVIVLFMIFAGGSIYTIDAGERGVLLRNGAVTDVVDSGMHFKLPIFESVAIISTRSHTQSYPRVAAYSKDQQPANIRVSITYSIPDAKVRTLYEQYKSIDNLLEATLNRQAYNQIENTFGRYSAVEVVTKREQFVVDVTNNLIKSLEAIPIKIELVQIENINFSDAYEKSIEQRMQAEVEVETQRQNLARERISAEIKITQAQAEADSKLAQAKAEAEAITLRGEAEAKAITARTQALSNSKYIELIKAERWNGSLPQTILPNASIPMINLDMGKE